jgi:PAS domain S-box-containing protein
VLNHPEEGSRLQVLESNTNITQRKASEEMLRASERQLQAFIESAPVAIAMLDTQLRYIVVSRRWRMDFNVSEDLVGRRHYDFFPDLPAHWLEAHQRALHGEGTGMSQERVQTRKGRTMWLRREVRPWYRGSEVGGIVIYAENVTVRVEADQVLQGSEARFRALADAMPQLLWISEPDGTVSYYNAQSLRYQHLNAGSSDWDRAVHPDDLPHTYERWRQATAVSTQYEVEHRLLMSDGSYRWHLSRGVPMRNASSGLGQIYGTSTDIDDRKRAEELLQEADRRKDAFLAMLSHELRNPLAPIRNAVYAMRRAQVIDPHIARCRDIIDRQAAQMARLLDDLLDISRITTGKLRLRTEPLELASVLEQAIETARPLIDEAGHHLEVRLPRQRITLDGDRTRLAQAIANLLVNAAKYTNRNGRIEVMVSRGEQEAQIKVRDNGIGISTNDLARIFDMFGQVPSSLTRAHGGLGIGLYLVRALVELHGGHVSARSEGHGHGSEFIVRLPVHAGTPVPEAHRTDGVAASNP